MKNFIWIAFASIILLAGFALSMDERLEEELSCQPVRGSITLPGILYDDLTPLARTTFDDDPATVSKALYSLPLDQRDEFINLYLEDESADRHRYFFARCQERAEGRTLSFPFIEPVVPTRLRGEIGERERIRASLRQGSFSYRLGNQTVFIPVPQGFDEYALPAEREGHSVDNHEAIAIFAKFPHRLVEDGFPPGSPIIAELRHIRSGFDLMAPMLAGYRVMVDDTWRVVGVSPPGATPFGAETVRYRWNLEPFGIRDGSFCYGGFEKVVDAHGRIGMSYRATAVMLLPGTHIQVDMAYAAASVLEVVDEVNLALLQWRDAILAVNQR